MSDESILQKQARLVEEFDALADWEARYQRIIARARALAPLPEADRTEANRVRGCSSQVWLSARLDAGRLRLLADSDAVLVKGLVALLLEVYDGHEPREILNAGPAEFLADMGLQEHLTPNRANGLSAMVKQIQAYALAFASAGR